MNNFDFLIVGGGVIGLSIARELHKRGGRNICVIECGEVGKEASWAAAGMLSPDIEAAPNGHFYRLCRRSLSMYPQFANELLDETGEDIELDRAGTISLSFEADFDLKSLVADQRKVGVNVHFLTSHEVFEIEPNLSKRVVGGMLYPDNWQVENRKLLNALMSFCERNEIEIHENSTVEKLNTQNGKFVGVETESGSFFAEHVVLATGAWTSLIKIADVKVPFEINPVLGQMICFRPKERLINCVTHGPRGYLVPRQDGRILAGSTSEDRGFDKGVTKKGIDELRSMAAELLQALSNETIVDSWSGLRPCSTDELPVIGNVSGMTNLTVATGHYRNGILLAPLTARIVVDAITGLEEFPNTFLPDRFLTDSTAAVAS